MDTNRRFGGLSNNPRLSQKPGVRSGLAFGLLKLGPD